MTNTSSQRFVRGERYKVVRESDYPRGFRPIGPSMETLWRKDHRIGDVSTCAATVCTAGTGVPNIRSF